MGRKNLASSLVGGLPETQEMLDFCAAHQIVSEIELIKMTDIHQAYERMLKGDVRYRFVIDIETLLMGIFQTKTTGKAFLEILKRLF